MLANNTGIRHLFAKIMRDYDKLMGSRGERRAFLDPYAQFPRFSDGNGSLIIDEFLDAKDVVSGLAAEYEACERADYVRNLFFDAGGVCGVCVCAAALGAAAAAAARGVPTARFVCAAVLSRKFRRRPAIPPNYIADHGRRRAVLSERRRRGCRGAIAIAAAASTGARATGRGRRAARCRARSRLLVFIHPLCAMLSSSTLTRPDIAAC